MSDALLQCSACGDPVEVYGKRGAVILTRCRGCGLDSGGMAAHRPARKRREDVHRGVEIVRIPDRRRPS